MVGKTLSGLCIGIALSFVSPTAGQAILIEKGLFSQNDRRLTLDTKSGLEWLDVTETIERSYDGVAGSSLVQQEGFRHATSTEVQELFANAGIVDFTGTFLDANALGAKEILSKLGSTTSRGNSRSIHRAIFELDPFDNRRIGVSQIFFDRATGGASTDQGSVIPLNPPSVTAGKDGFIPTAGHYLVRAANKVPEPSSWSLMLLGLTFLGTALRLSKRPSFAEGRT